MLKSGEMNTRGGGVAVAAVCDAGDSKPDLNLVEVKTFSALYKELVSIVGREVLATEVTFVSRVRDKLATLAKCKVSLASFSAPPPPPPPLLLLLTATLGVLLLSASFLHVHGSFSSTFTFSEVLKSPPQVWVLQSHWSAPRTEQPGS